MVVNGLSVGKSLHQLFTSHPKMKQNIINNWMRKNDFSSRTLIIYGKNASDNSVFDKYTQLKQIGFSNIYIYSGGLFEWLLLQDIYGSADFPTTKQNVDLLKYREPQILF